MNIIYKCEFGSIIYGTSTPTSDQDFKAIYLPSKKDILLQQVKRVVNLNTKEKGAIERNKSDDIDFEIFSFQEYLKLLLEGQTPMLDMLFCPPKHILKCDWPYQLIYNNKKEFLHKGTSQFVGYTMQQAAKYGLKGSRVNACNLALEYLKTIPDTTKTFNHYPEIAVWMYNQLNEYIKVLSIYNKTTDRNETFLEVCNRKIPLNSKIKNGIDVLQAISDKYGERARMAADNEGIDWKALYHSVRVGKQAEELLLTGNITLPRPEAPLLMKIRKGELPYVQVAELIEQGLVNMEVAKLQSSLPDKPNYDFADKIVQEVYEVIVNE